MMHQPSKIYKTSEAFFHLYILTALSVMPKIESPQTIEKIVYPQTGAFESVIRQNGV